MRNRIARTTLLLAVAALGVACTKSLDTTQLASQVESKLKTQFGDSDFTVHCPSSVKVQSGTTFTCTATVPGGQTLTLLLTQTNDHGDVDMKISGASGGDSPAPTATPTS
jgi:hypothetical protein